VDLRSHDRGESLRTRFIIAIVAIVQSSSWLAAEINGAQNREYPVSIPAVRAALQNLGAYTGARLPNLEGFTKEQVEVQQYQRPYYEFNIELVPVTPTRTQVQIKANVSVWYEGPDGPPGYRTLTSNGRLESDLLDRLDDYLKDKSDDPKVLSQTITELQTKRTEADHQVSLLEEQLRNLKSGTNLQTGNEFVSVRRRISVKSAPTSAAKPLLQAQAEDEFPVLDHRGEWLKVGLANGESGWVTRSEVVPDAAMPVTGPSVAESNVPGFTVIREQTTDFSGDWARLRSKRALYVWARADGSMLNVGTGDRLAFVEKVFNNRYREIAHGAGDPVDGVVVIFLDQRGGVAAAALDDIRAWVEGGISSSAFLKKCSLDPPTAFQESTSAPDRQGKQRKVSYHPAGFMKHPS
jgi:hypothetical protein